MNEKGNEKGNENSKCGLTLTAIMEKKKTTTKLDFINGINLKAPLLLCMNTKYVCQSSAIAIINKNVSIDPFVLTALAALCLTSLTFFLITCVFHEFV